MKIQTKTLVFAAATFAAITTVTSHAQAGCGGGGHRGGHRGGHHSGHRGSISVGSVSGNWGGSGHHGHHHSVAPLHHNTPTYHSTPVYQTAPVTYAAPLQPSHVISSQPVYSTPLASPSIVSQPVFSQQVISQPAVARPVPSQLAPSQPILSQPVASPSVVRQSTSQASKSTLSTEASDLAMLASINQAPSAKVASQIPQFGATPSAASTPDKASAHVGTWAASLPGNQAVTLNLGADGSFTWTATKDGKSNSFNGQYRLSNGRLTLVRSSDLQQMKGGWIVASSGFTFKVDGETSGGLRFNRS